MVRRRQPAKPGRSSEQQTVAGMVLVRAIAPILMNVFGLLAQSRAHPTFLGMMMRIMMLMCSSHVGIPRVTVGSTIALILFWPWYRMFFAVVYFNSFFDVMCC